MSLNIDIGTVVAVLLADGWHEVNPDSFYIDAYEYAEDADDDDVLYNGERQGCSTGFRFQELTAGQRHRIAGPMTSILAVRCDRDA